MNCDCTPLEREQYEMIETLEDRIRELEHDLLWRRAADRLAYAVAKLIERRVLDARCNAADALLDYLEIGAIDKPASVPQWVEQYEAAKQKKDA